MWPETWDCPACAVVNLKSDKKCRLCNEPKPKYPPKSSED
jgi:hypothetical protein